MSGTYALKGPDAADHERALTGPLARFFSVVQRVKRPCIICSRIPLTHSEVAALLSLPLVEGIILESEDRELLAAFPDRLGFNMLSGRNWQLPAKVAADMIYVGRWADFGARVAWLAWRAGIRRIHNASVFQSYRTSNTIWVAISKSLRSLLYRLWQSPLRPRLGENAGRIFQLEQYLFSRRLRSIKNLPLPIVMAPVAWQRGKIVMVGGTLGPGVAERQLTATLLGLFARRYQDMHFLHHAPMHKPNDFFLPQLIEAGIPFSQVSLIGDSNPVSPDIAKELGQRLAPLGDLGVEIAAYAREFLVRQPEVVHIWLDYTNVVAGLAAALVGVPRVVLSCRSLSPAHFAFNQPYMRPIYRLLAKCPNVVFLNNSEAGAADYKRWLGLSSLKIQVIRNGFDFSVLPSPEDLPHLRSEYRRRFGIPADVPVVGVIMRISEEKRPLLWVEIARQVGLQIRDAHFVVIGDGPMRKQTEAMGQEALPGRIHFPGHEKNAFLAIAAMDLFLLTSRMEGLPNVLIEAQAVGVPPVAIDAGGARETMKDSQSGWIIPTSNAAVIANKVASLLADKAVRAAASQYGSRFVHTEFSAPRMIDETLRIYGYAN